MDLLLFFDNILTANILGMWEKRRSFTPNAGVPLPSEPVSQYRCTDFWTFLKLMIMIEQMKMMQMSYLVIWQVLLFGQVSHRSNSRHFFQNLENPVLVQTLSYKRKITYHLLLFAFFHKLQFQSRMLDIVCCICL